MNEPRVVKHRLIAGATSPGELPMRSDPFVETLLNDTAKALRLASRQCDGIRGAIYLFLCRAYEARLSAEAVCDLLGTAGDCVLNRACLEQREEDEVLEAYAAYDVMLRELYCGSEATSPTAGMRG